MKWNQIEGWVFNKYNQMYIFVTDLLFQICNYLLAVMQLQLDFSPGALGIPDKCHLDASYYPHIHRVCMRGDKFL